MDLRTVLAAVLGVGLGLLLVVSPETVVRAQTAGRLPRDRGGEYGSESAVSDRWLSLVRLLGLASALLGLYFGFVAVTAGGV
jgi:hypothetical protein